MLFSALRLRPEPGALPAKLCRAILASPLLALACASPENTDGETGETTSTTGETGEDGEAASLIDHELWQVVEADVDPLADHRPDPVECSIAGWYIEAELDTLEVDTNFCNYLALGQPSLAALEQGQLVQLVFYHFDLVAPTDVVAHVAILIDGQVLWEQEIAIPGDANVFVEEFPSPITAALGSQVVFHLHNHGQNTWALQELTTTP